MFSVEPATFALAQIVPEYGVPNVEPAGMARGNVTETVLPELNALITFSEYPVPVHVPLYDEPATTRHRKEPVFQ